MAADKSKLYYTDDHEWIEVMEDDTVRIGITDYAVEQLGDIVFVELPEVGSEAIQKERFGAVESVKSASDIYAPVSGEVIEVNEALDGEPEILNDSPFEEGWIAALHTPGPFSKEDLLTYDEYKTYLGTLD